jgi:hypothetical protein
MSRDRVVRHRARSYWVPDVRPKAFSGMTETYVLWELVQSTSEVSRSRMCG